MFLCACTWFVLASPPCLAQGTTARDELLRLVPKDTAICLVVHDLRGHSQHLAAWYDRLQRSPLGKGLVEAPEFRKLARFEDDLKTLLNFDWPRLRDDILGDAVVFAYRSGPPDRPQDEEGLLLLQARSAGALIQLVDRLNEQQKKAGEIKDIVAVEHAGRRYFRRIEKDNTHYYYIDGRLLVFTTKEPTLRAVMEQHVQTGAPALLPLAEQFQRAGADKALATLWVNPRAFDQDIQRKIQKGSANEALVLKGFLGYWRAIEGVLLALHLGDDLELQLSVQARPKDLPASASRLFADSAKVSELWGRFPADALVTIASRVEVAAATEVLVEFTPTPVRKVAGDGLQRALGAALGLDLTKDLLPNLGPDWGLAVLPPPDQKSFPHVLAALAVRPGSKDVPVDQALNRGLQFFAGLAVFEYNRTHKKRLRLQTTKQGNIQVRYVTGDDVFPAGFQPSFALKGGYLVLASSPAAIARFGKGAVPAFPGGETPLVRVSVSELAKLFQERRDQLIGQLVERNGYTRDAAGQTIDRLIAVGAVLDQIQLNHRSSPGQATWILRLRPGQGKQPSPNPVGQQRSGG
jgi:hypothetical protein